MGMSVKHLVIDIIIPIVLVLIQLFGVFIFLIIGRLETTLLAILAFIMTLVFIAAHVSPKYKSHFHIIHLGFVIPYFLSGTIFIILWFSSYYQRCVNWADLSQRVTPEITRDESCIAYQLKLFVLALGLLTFACIEFEMAFIGRYYFLRNKKLEEYQGNRFEKMSGEAERIEAEVELDEWTYPGDPQTKRARWGLFAVGLGVGVIILGSILLIALLPNNVDREKEGVCPADHRDFFKVPEENDLDCCEWHQNTTCCHRRVCKDKPQAVQLGGLGSNVKECDDLLGLINCAPCKYNSAHFLSHITSSVDPWDESGVTVCHSFCGELFDACWGLLLERSASAPYWECAWGQTCLFAQSGFNASTFNTSAVDEKTLKVLFCEGWGLDLPADENSKDCFSSSLKLLPNINLLIFIVFVVSFVFLFF